MTTLLVIYGVVAVLFAFILFLYCLVSYVDAWLPEDTVVVCRSVIGIVIWPILATVLVPYLIVRFAWSIFKGAKLGELLPRSKKYVKK